MHLPTAALDEPRRHARWPIVVLLASLALVAASTATASPSKQSCPGVRAGIVFYSDAVSRWNVQRGDHPPRIRTHAASCKQARHVARRLQLKARVERARFDAWYDRTYAKWACIHSKEGAWNAANDSYGGGLQFDQGFQWTYGSEFIVAYGAAGSWPVWAQLIAAERAYNGYHGYGPRGYSAWPNTRRACGV